MERILSYTEEQHEFGGLDPGKPVPGIMQVFMDEGAPSMVDFLCPCGCGHTVPTHLVRPGTTKMPNDRHWHYAPGPTLSPSIRFTGGCYAHFTITNGVVKFHGDSGQGGDT